jgi:hypothetical protein
VQVTATLADNDPPGAVTINNGVLTVNGGEGDSALVIPVTLAQASGQNVTVDVSALNGTAQAGSDFIAPSSVTILAGQTSASVTVSLIDDNLDEPDETFVVQFTNFTNATPSSPTVQVTATLADNDPPGGQPAVSIADATGVEGDGGLSRMEFVVALSSPATRPTWLFYVTSDATASGGLRSDAGADYVPALGLLLFRPGETRKTIAVRVFGDTRAEGDETFFINLIGPPALLNRSRAVGTIVDDDDGTVALRRQ